MNIPKDPNILFSYINTQLRDNYSSLDELCSSLGADKNEITQKLSALGYRYDEDKNLFTAC
ncbi:MAG: DUF4250 domain-containing protein [Eubacterium sp.]|nr:DUF4250 domain-containing protein [Eubacterium sp.]